MVAGADAGQRCDECGAPSVDGVACREQFGAVLAWEWSDPELQAQHFLTVASYNLQHPSRFTDAALARLRSAFRDHLEHGLPVVAIRRQNARMFERERVIRPEQERSPVLREWAMTVADVYDEGRADGAAERVRKWASLIRSQLERVEMDRLHGPVEDGG